MAGPVGIEPTLAVLETDVLPLYEGPMYQICKQHYILNPAIFQSS